MEHRQLWKSYSELVRLVISFRCTATPDEQNLEEISIYILRQRRRAATNARTSLIISSIARHRYPLAISR